MREGRKIYLPTNVLDAARERISMVFDHFETIVTSISGGKDSTVLLDLCREEAVKRGRQVQVFFLDQEAEYQATIDQIEYSMELDAVVPHWYQVPIKMTNAASLKVDFLNAWWPGETWMREKSPISVHELTAEYPRRFYPFIEWWEKQWPADTTCFLVALRAEESLNRFRTVAKNPGWNGQNWTSGVDGTIKAYPLYDWTFEDVWHHIAVNHLRYNQVYDFMHRKGFEIQNVRVSYLGHENSYKCLESLHEFEPETYRRLLDRMPGIHVAARYSNERMIFNAKKLPPAFDSWHDYRDFLLDTSPSLHRERFIKRFAGQGKDEDTYRQQCRQLLINDWESSVPVVKHKSRGEALQKWRDIL